MLFLTLVFAAVFASMGIIALPTTTTSSSLDNFYRPVTIEQISPLQQMPEGSTLQLHCFVTFHDEAELRLVEWLFVSDQTEDEAPKVLTSNGSVVTSEEGRIKAKVRRRKVRTDAGEFMVRESSVGEHGRQLRLLIDLYNLSHFLPPSPAEMRPQFLPRTEAGKISTK